MAGPAIRYWELARLLSREAEVVLAAPEPPPIEGNGFRVVHYRPWTIHALVRWCDVVISQGFRFPLSALLLTRRRVVIDLYDPLPLELLDHYREMPPNEACFAQRYATIRLDHLLRIGDAFLCTGERQRAFWLGMLAAAGRLNWHTSREDPLLHRLAMVVPFGLPSDPPRRVGPGLRGLWGGLRDSDRILVWGGGVWDWLDPLTVIRAMALVAPKHDDVKLIFAGTRHPNPKRVQARTLTRAVELARSLGLYERTVFFNADWIPYDRRQDALLDAEVGVSAHPDHLEARFAFRTRLLDYFWAGLPVICTRGDDLADTVEASGAGLVLAPGDVTGWAEAILRLMDDPDLRARCRAASGRLALEMTWEKTAAPLLAYCRHPRPAPDSGRTIAGGAAALLAYGGSVAWAGVRYRCLRRIWRRLLRR